MDMSVVSDLCGQSRLSFVQEQILLKKNIAAVYQSDF